MTLGEGASLENILSQAASNGWEFFDGPGGEKSAAEKLSEEKAKRLSQIAAALYEVPQFRELLDALADGTLRRAAFLTPLGFSLEQFALQGAFREGQNAAIFAIFKLIAQGREQQLKGRDA